uniref:SAP domain-containing ribonucleoprotein-like n=1 Tax=Sinocyclocheilus anshuiensis TaxID=1608454 RepID=A0A671PQS4_9TELE
MFIYCALDFRVTEKKLVKINPPAAVGERLQKRAERFDLPPNADSKKAARAVPFFIFHLHLTNDVVLHSSYLNVCVCSQIEDDEKLKKRKERFGIVTSAASAGTNDTEVWVLLVNWF